MIRVKVYGTREHFEGFKVEGHALFDDPGKDVVCAAVSILTINTINAIEEFVKDQKMQAVSDEKKGYIELKLLNEAKKDTLLLTDTFLLGIRGIIGEYGTKYVKLENGF